MGLNSMQVYGGTVAELKNNNILLSGIKHKIKFLCNFPFVYIPRCVHSNPSRMNPYPLVLIYLKGKHQRHPALIQEFCVTEMSECLK
jgi:hypothetical protein